MKHSQNPMKLYHAVLVDISWFQWSVAFHRLRHWSRLTQSRATARSPAQLKNLA
jgi:hypothetical protein